MSRYHTGDQIDLKSTSLKFETRNSNGEKTSHNHNGEPCFNCKVLGLLNGKKGNSFNVFFHVILIANEPAERRRSAGEAAENSAARRMLYAEKFSNDL